MKKCILLLMSVVLLTGCSVHIGNPPEGEERITKAEVKETPAKNVKDAVVSEEPEVESEVPEADAPTKDENTNVVSDASFDGWSAENMDASVVEFFSKLQAYRDAFGTADAIYVTKYDAPTYDYGINIINALDEYNMVRYSKAWDIGYNTDLNSVVTFEDDDELARAFGFESAEVASDLWNATEYLRDEQAAKPRALYADPYEYSFDWSAFSEIYTFNDEQTTTVTTDEGSALSYDSEGRGRIYFSNAGTSRVVYNDKYYWIIVPDAYSTVEDEVCFDTHRDVTIYGDWAALIDEMTEGIQKVNELPSYAFKKDRGILIIAEESFPDIDENKLTELHDYLMSYYDQLYEEELVNPPTKEELDKYTMPYMLYREYFGVEGITEGANVQRLAGDNYYWENFDIGGKMKEE